MTRWYSTYHHILIFGTIIFLTDKPSTFALRIETDQQRIEYALHNFMAKKNALNFSVENASKLGRRMRRKFSICGLRVSRKLNLCKRALVEEDEFAEEFETFDCKPEKFEYSFHFEDVKKNPQISMYQCPKLLRRHPRTGFMTADSRQLFVSRMSLGIEQAMVYKREHEGGTLKPARHLLDITKAELDTEPPPSQVIRSRGRFQETPVRSARNSPSPTRSSPRFKTAPNSPSQLNPFGVSPERSPAHSSIANQSPGRNILGGITPSMFLSPMVRSPQNVGTGRSRERTKSRTPTSTGSPLHSKSRPATPASRSGSSTPYFSPSLSPAHPSAAVAAGTRRQRRPPPGIVLRGTTDPSRPSSASGSGESTDDSSGITDLAKQRGLGSSRFAGASNIGDDTGTGRRKAATDFGKRTGTIGTGKLGAVKAYEWEAVSTGSNIPTGHPKQMYKHKSFNRDRAYHSESNSPPNEGAEFSGFMTPVPVGTSVADILGDSLSPGSAIHRTQSDNILGTYDDSNVSYPLWPKLRQGSTEVSEESSKEDLKDDSSADAPTFKSKGPISREKIISEWRQLQKQRKMKSEVNKKYTGEVLAAEEENKAEEDISEASVLNEANFLSAYGENVKRHHTDKPSVLNTSLSDDYSKESDTDLADTSASVSFPARKDFSVQVDLLDEKDSSMQADLPGDSDTPMEEDEAEKGTSGTVLFTATTDPEVFKEGTTILSRSSTKTSDISTGNDESVQAAPPGMKHESDRVIPPATKDQSIQVKLPAKREVSVGAPVHSIKSDTTTAGLATSADTPSPESTNLVLPTDRDTVDQVDESEETRNINPASANTYRPTDISGKEAHTLFQALSGQDDVVKASTNVGSPAVD